MSKVKKVARKTGVRNVKATKPVKKARSAGRKKKPAKKAKLVASPKRRANAVVSVPAVKVEIKELDPIRKCGPGTSVQVLLRVIERLDGKSTSHLVFFDKHGWYCEHGRSCPAVAHARKRVGRLASSRH